MPPKYNNIILITQQYNRFFCNQQNLYIVHFHQFIINQMVHHKWVTRNLGQNFGLNNFGLLGELITMFLNKRPRNLFLQVNHDNISANEQLADYDSKWVFNEAYLQSPFLTNSFVHSPYPQKYVLKIALLLQSKWCLLPWESLYLYYLSIESECCQTSSSWESKKKRKKKKKKYFPCT